MKNSIRILGVFTLIAAYCLVVGSVTNTFLSSNYSDQNSQQEQYLSVFTNSLLSHTSPSERLVKVPNTFSVRSIKNLPQAKWGLDYRIAILWEITFTQCCSDAILFWIQIRKSGIIFPFHFFW